MAKKIQRSEVRFQSFPRSCPTSAPVLKVVKCFSAIHAEIDSYTHPSQESDEVLRKLTKGFQSIDYKVETGKKLEQKVVIPVLMGCNNKPEKTFNVDAFNEKEGIAIEVEAGQAVVNFRFLKDLFEACQMPSVRHLIIVVRNVYGKNKSDDFEKVRTFLETLYVNGRLKLPLESVTVVGY